jgi:hypothetical protein
VVGQARRPGRRRAAGVHAGLQGAVQRRVQADPLSGQQLAVDRLGDQRMAEDIAVAIRLGEQHLVVDCLAQAVQQPRLAHTGDRGKHRLGDARAGRGDDAEDTLGAAAKAHDPGQEHLLEARRQRSRPMPATPTSAPRPRFPPVHRSNPTDFLARIPAPP